MSMRPTTKLAKGYFESAEAFAARKAEAVKAAHEFQTKQAITAKKEAELRRKNNSGS